MGLLPFSRGGPFCVPYVPTTPGSGSWVETGDTGIVDASLFGSDSATGTFTTDKTDSMHATWDDASGDFSVPVSFKAELRTNDSTGVVGLEFMSGFPTTLQTYRVASTDLQSFRLSAVGFTPTFQGSVDSGVIPAVGAWYEILVDLETISDDEIGDSLRIRVKIWPQSAAEPSSYQIDVQDFSSSRRLNGSLGIYGAN